MLILRDILSYEEKIQLKALDYKVPNVNYILDINWGKEKEPRKIYQIAKHMEKINC